MTDPEAALAVFSEGPDLNRAIRLGGRLELDPAELRALPTAPIEAEGPAHGPGPEPPGAVLVEPVDLLLHLAAQAVGRETRLGRRSGPGGRVESAHAAVSRHPVSAVTRLD